MQAAHRAYTIPTYIQRAATMRAYRRHDIYYIVNAEASIKKKGRGVMLEKIIRETIEAAGVTQMETSKRMGRGARYIGVLLTKAQSGRKSIALSTFIALCNACGARVVLVDKAGRVTDLTDAL